MVDAEAQQAHFAVTIGDNIVLRCYRRYRMEQTLFQVYANFRAV